VLVHSLVPQGGVTEEILVNPNDLVREENVNMARLRFFNMLLLRLRIIPRDGSVIFLLVFYAIFTAVGVVLLAVSSHFLLICLWGYSKCLLHNKHIFCMKTKISLNF